MGEPKKMTVYKLPPLDELEKEWLRDVDFRGISWTELPVAFGMTSEPEPETLDELYDWGAGEMEPFEGPSEEELLEETRKYITAAENSPEETKEKIMEIIKDYIRAMIDRMDELRSCAEEETCCADPGVEHRVYGVLLNADVEESLQFFKLVHCLLPVLWT